MTRFLVRGCLGAGAILLALGLTACESGETIAPEGATIVLSASPAQIVLVDEAQASPVTILATVRSSLGVPLTGQDVRFTTTNGNLTDPRTGDAAVGVPVETDDDGNAQVELNDATTTTTITATSGKATDSINLQAASGEIAHILLSASPTAFSSCSDSSIMITATVTDSGGTGLKNIEIDFETVTADAPVVEFTHDPFLTDADGKVMSTMTFFQGTNSDCQPKCAGAGNDCGFAIQAKTTDESFTSNQVDLTDLVN